MLRGHEANSSRYFGDKDIEGMFATLGPLHDQLSEVSCSSIPLWPATTHHE